MPGKKLDAETTLALLASAEVGRLATVDQDGYPYVTPMQFAFVEGLVYLHSKNGGEKIRNIRACAKVGFEIDVPGNLRTSDTACDTSCDYRSVIVRGTARIVDDAQEKARGLDLLVAKYVPQHAGEPYPDAMLARTVVVVVTPESCTGKYNSASL